MSLYELSRLHVLPSWVSAHKRDIRERLCELYLVYDGHHVVLVVAPFQGEEGRRVFPALRLAVVVTHAVASVATAVVL